MELTPTIKNTWNWAWNVHEKLRIQMRLLEIWDKNSPWTTIIHIKL